MNDFEARSYRRRRLFLCVAVPTLLSAGVFLIFHRVLGQDPNDPQVAIDAAAFEAAHQIALALLDARLQGDDPAETTVAASRQAGSRAAEVAARYGIDVDPVADIQFGFGRFDSASGNWSVAWGQWPFNVVRVTKKHEGNRLQAEPDLPMISRTIRIYGPTR